MTTEDILARADEIDDQNSRMAGLVVALCIPVILASGTALAYAISYLG